MWKNSRGVWDLLVGVLLVATFSLTGLAQDDDRAADDDRARERFREHAERERDRDQPEHEEERTHDIISRVLERFPGVEPDRVVDFIRNEFPREFREFRELASKRTGEAMEIMGNLVRHARELIEMKHRDPERFERMMARRRLEREAAELAVAMRHTEGEERAALQKRLRGVLVKAFSLKQELLRGEAARREAELGELRTLITKREESRDAIVDRRLDQLTGQADHLEW